MTDIKEITMTTLQIITNNRYRPVQYYYELSRKQQAIVQDYHDYMTQYEMRECPFVVYKDRVFSLGDFMRISNHPDEDFSKWHGYHSDSFFSGTLIKLSDCGDAVIMGWYMS